MLQQGPPLPPATVPKDTLDLWDILQRADYILRVVPVDEPKINVADIIELLGQGSDEGGFGRWAVSFPCGLHKRDLHASVSNQALDKLISGLSESGGDWRVTANQNRCSRAASYCINDGSYVVKRACITHVVHVVTEYGC